jgi:hypothetical protein
MLVETATGTEFQLTAIADAVEELREGRDPVHLEGE